MTERQHMPQWLHEIKWTLDGLVPAIAQDYKTGEILMMAWMNQESLALTVKEKRSVFWSRSRQALWRKGESSGYIQHLHDIRLDCDADVILLKVEQIGDISCHTGRRSCFYRSLNTTKMAWESIEPVLKNPNEIYNS